MTNAGIAGPNYIGNRRDKKTMDIMEMQRNIKHNNEDLISFVDDLDSWMKEVEKKDKNQKLRDPNQHVSAPKPPDILKRPISGSGRVGPRPHLVKLSFCLGLFLRRFWNMI